MQKHTLPNDPHDSLDDPRRLRTARSPRYALVEEKRRRLRKTLQHAVQTVVMEQRSMKANEGPVERFSSFRRDKSDEQIPTLDLLGVPSPVGELTPQNACCMLRVFFYLSTDHRWV